MLQPIERDQQPEQPCHDQPARPDLYSKLFNHNLWLLVIRHIWLRVCCLLLIARTAIVCLMRLDSIIVHSLFTSAMVLCEPRHEALLLSNLRVFRCKKVSVPRSVRHHMHHLSSVSKLLRIMFHTSSYSIAVHSSCWQR